MKKSNIDWCDHVLNPVIGCKHNCSFGCYAERDNKFRKWVKKWNEPEVKYGWIKKLKTIKEPSRIFVGSLTDLFGDWVPEDWITKTLSTIDYYPQHTFMFLTKNPKRYKEFNFPKNCWLGVTVTGIDDWRNVAMLHTTPKNNLKFVSIEPILDVIATGYFWLADWIILGGLTPKPVHKQKWIKDFLDLGRKSGRPIFMKKNLNWKGKLRQEYPK